MCSNKVASAWMGVRIYADELRPRGQGYMALRRTYCVGNLPMWFLNVDAIVP
jgi:hypothetical protein